VNALIMSGQKTSRFSFEAFLPADKKERKKRLAEISKDTRTIIVYEAPHHLVNTLKDLLEELGDRNVSLCRELTKKHEDLYRGTLSKALEHFTEEEPRGEFVLVIEGADEEELKRKSQEAFSEMTVEEHLQMYLSQGLDKKEAMKKVALDRGVSKRDIYKETL
ncbi:MAG: 16S rRNA (cytidine(1402)-2'-O)-methyltransferase, partial [Lachnospiraceae bacterium]|nr:16S rRNA (cytidine(1402)-2'-O)-methyltransferase [Lachnospiraceae bacterium]